MAATPAAPPAAGRGDRPVRRARVVLILGALSAFGPLSIDMYLPGLPSLGATLDAPAWAVQLTLTACLAGLALGQVVAGPLSDRFGRRTPLLVGVAAYAAASLLCALAPTILALVVLRFVQGIAGAAGIVIARAIVRDMHSGVAAARFFSLLMLVNGLAPILAPVIGGQVLRVTTWRGVFVLLAGIGVVLVAAAAAGLRETLAPEDRHPGGVAETIRTFGRLLGDRVFLGHALACGLAFGAMFAYISGSPFVLQDIYGASPQVFSVLFAANALGIVGASQANRALLRRFEPRAILRAALVVQASAGVALLGGRRSPARACGASCRCCSSSWRASASCSRTRPRSRSPAIRAWRAARRACSASCSSSSARRPRRSSASRAPARRCRWRGHRRADRGGVALAFAILTRGHRPIGGCQAINLRHTPPGRSASHTAAGHLEPAQRTRESGHAGHRGQQPAQALRRHGRGGRRVVHRGGGRDLRHPRPQRRGQDHHRRVRRRAAHARRRRRSGCSASTRAGPRRAPRARSASSSRRAALPDKLRVGEALELYASFYRDPADWRELLDALGLAEQAEHRFGKLSGGQQQRLSIALALIGNPQVAVLDELTTGLDPQARRDTWELIEHIRDRGVTIVLVTHFMEEAERLCDRVALIDPGRVVALDTPAGLAARVAASSGPVPAVRPRFDDRLLTGTCPRCTGDPDRRRRSSSPAPATSSRRSPPPLARHQLVAADLRVEQASLDDAFVALTGRPSTDPSIRRLTE